MAKKVDFLMNLDCFQSCSKNAVIKFTYLMEKVKFKRNQKVYTDGQSITKVYIVWKGEFEVEAKLHKRDDANQARVQKVMGINMPVRNILAKKLPEVQDLPVTHKLTI